MGSTTLLMDRWGLLNCATQTFMAVLRRCVMVPPLSLLRCPIQIEDFVFCCLQPRCSVDIFDSRFELDDRPLVQGCGYVILFTWRLLSTRESLCDCRVKLAAIPAKTTRERIFTTCSIAKSHLATFCFRLVALQQVLFYFFVNSPSTSLLYRCTTRTTSTHLWLVSEICLTGRILQINPRFGHSTNCIRN